ncbi:MAG TPA: hypothetical protein VJ733_07100 [Candidatus Binatia bacterium]|nr:hypothetical protein [Candidatus Binatia bacterium]
MPKLICALTWIVAVAISSWPCFSFAADASADQLYGSLAKLPADQRAKRIEERLFGDHLLSVHRL